MRNNQHSGQAIGGNEGREVNRNTAAALLLAGLALLTLPTHLAAEGLIATTVEAAPAQQQTEADAVMQRLQAALNSCDGGHLYGLLPSWERALLPAIAFDAVHGSADRVVGDLSLEQAALSPYARAVLWLRKEHQPKRADELSASTILHGWCEANRAILSAVYGRLQVRDWQWLRTPPQALLSGCPADTAVTRSNRLSLLLQQEQWRYALLEGTESLVLSAFAQQPPTALLEARSSFLQQLGGMPAPAAPENPPARAAVSEISAEPDLEAYAGLIERLAAIPPCQ